MSFSIVANLGWYINRLRAMSGREIVWRLSQKRLEGAERKRFSNKYRVDTALFYDEARDSFFDYSRLPINLQNRVFTHEREISLLGKYSYEEYRTRWHAGFQTANDWPLEVSYDLAYKQRDDIGDARTNWELNRGFQFALLAKAYYASGDVSFLQELQFLEDSWAQENPFLWGISWTSVMEIAIRCINWMYAAAFLKASNNEDAMILATKFSSGAANMAAYVARHYSRFSSSNNHAIVEACALGLAGMTYGVNWWTEIASSILEVEVIRQNHNDGVNKEQSLHYQAFFMEAVGLYLLACRVNSVKTPIEWEALLAKMCAYVQDCRVAPGVWLEFGDDDEGIILNLRGPRPDACEYVLQLMGVVLESDERWSDYDATCETLCWLCDESVLVNAADKKLRDNSACVTYPVGGVSIMRSTDGRVVVGMDHGPLGFGSIAAHGHADALSIQLYIDGQCVIGDPGTYIYHCDFPARNELRKTRNHSTVCIDGKDQSEMLGAFMWGKRAESKLLQSGYLPDGSYIVEALHDGYAPAIHKRKFTFLPNGNCVIDDEVDGVDDKECVCSNMVISPQWSVSVDGCGFSIGKGDKAVLAANVNQGSFEVASIPYSCGYASISSGSRICMTYKCAKSIMRIEVK